MPKCAVCGKPVNKKKTHHYWHEKKKATSKSSSPLGKKHYCCPSCSDNGSWDKWIESQSNPKPLLRGTVNR